MYYYYPGEAMIPMSANTVKQHKEMHIAQPFGGTTPIVHRSAMPIAHITQASRVYTIDCNRKLCWHTTHRTSRALPRYNDAA